MRVWARLGAIIGALSLSTAVLAQTPTFEQAAKAFKQGNFSAALAGFQPLAEQGQAAAQVVLGLMYAEGSGVPKDPETAYTWWLKAAAQGNADAKELATGMEPRLNHQQIARARSAAAQTDAKRLAVKTAAPAAPVPSAGQPQKLGCDDALALKNTYTPLDLYAALPQCMEKTLYPQAGLFFALAGTYGMYDRLRVRDVAAHQTLAALKMTYTDKLPDDFKNYLATLSSGPPLAQLCDAVRKVGSPQYFPHYMAQSGAAARPIAMDESADDPQQLWHQALDTYLHCPD
jgi:hypothetical protein